ncbi:MAG: L,D-transpeptidase [Actinomycetota bacterium]|nr:L,D-transpeptidase [Actinomycetota bacterium]
MNGARRMPWVGALALLVALALLRSASAAGAPAGSEPLTDERTYAHWAHAQHSAAVRQLPSHDSPRVARLHHRTEDGFPEVYSVLRRLTERDGRSWLQITVPRRPNGRTGWIPDSALGPLYRVRTRLVVDRRRLRATLYRAGKAIWRSPIGIGKKGTSTPNGDFWIREKFRVANPRGPYGPRAFGTSAYSRLSDWPGGGVIGIHGTNEPSLIPGRPSHGCIRIVNHAIKRLYRLMPVGTPMHVR